MAKKIGSALVVGAGIGGIRASLDLAESGYRVTVVDRQPHIGGLLSQLDYQFPTNRCGMCKMLPLVERDAASQFCLRKGLFHENIDLLLSTEISAVEGEPGRFSVSVRQKPSSINARRCIGCGLCTGVCPVTVEDEFNAGLGSRKAVYLPVPHQVPNAYVIDSVHCSRCGACVEVCPTGAIDLAQDQRKAFAVLVVDDERIVRDSLKDWLEEEGFTAVAAESGPAALERLEERPFDLMLTDIKMPGMDGIEVLEKALAAHPGLTVIMMTAYATVDTAVEAMKMGAVDYLVKPFDPDALTPMVVRVYEKQQASGDRRLEVGAIVWCGGTDSFDPASGRDVFSYGAHPNVVTATAFERLLSGAGPTGGRLLRPDDGRPVEKIAWMQCVGSRDLNGSADFCSSICCMYAVKEAMIAKEHSGGPLETTVFYTDMRTFGKSFQRYRDRAENECGVRFVRGRVHTVVPGGSGKDLLLRYAGFDGQCRQESFDMVVLAAGQRPSGDSDRLMEVLGVESNLWGFPRYTGFSKVRTANAGVFLGGTTTGLADISESVMQSSAAACAASQLLRSTGGGLRPEEEPKVSRRDVSRELAKTMLVLCRCGRKDAPLVEGQRLERHFSRKPGMDDVLVLDRLCTADGWAQLEEAAEKSRANRVLIGACHPYLFGAKLLQLGRRIGLNPALMEVVDIATPAVRHLGRDSGPGADAPPAAEPARTAAGIVAAEQKMALETALSWLQEAEPDPAPTIPVVQRALVVGGGAAGMRAALAVADHGFPVHLVEKSDRLGGNLCWLAHTLEGEAPADLLEELVAKVAQHPGIEVHLETRISKGFGQVGGFYTTLAAADDTRRTFEHGVVILATGGEEAATRAYGCGESAGVITQKTFEQQLADGTLDPGSLSSVVMIQCVDSRQEPRNYCSRICCAGSLKHALYLKRQNPQVNVYIFYRDMMTYGFSEARYTEARRAGVIFFPYDPADKPEVRVPDEEAAGLTVEGFDPVAGRRVSVEADRVVLATGVVPRIEAELAAAFGVETDADGFFKEAEPKWRPVDALAEGVFCCGLALSPRNIAEALVSAEAAAERSLRILEKERLPTGRVVAEVRHSLCSLCESCIGQCPYNARTLDPDLAKILVNPAMCQGCGSCAAACPNGAAVVVGARGKQFFGAIDAALANTTVG